MATPSQEFPQQFGKYTLLRKLARGGMAELFLARTADSPRLYVIKRILPAMSMDTQFLSMFLTEARVAAQLDHPNIIKIYDLGREGTHFYLAMEYIDGIDLEHLVRLSDGKLPPDLMARIGMDLCDALHFANRSMDMSTGKPLNVIHRDVTPGNVMITRQGVVKLVDFGVAKATAQLERTKTGIVKGKFRYMSPEQLQLQELDGRSDLFSVGVLLYEMSTGIKPFERPQVIDVIRALTAWEPPPPAKAVPSYPKMISDVIVHALAKDREKRFSDGTEMKLALEKALAAIQNPLSVQEFVSRFLPPPIDVPPFVPPPVPPPIPDAAKEAPVPPPSTRQASKEKASTIDHRFKQQLDENDEDDDCSTMLGLPLFDTKGRVIGHQTLAEPHKARDQKSKLPLPADDFDVDTRWQWDDGVTQSDTGTSSALPARSPAPHELRMNQEKRAQPSFLPRSRRSALQDEEDDSSDEEGTIAMQSNPRLERSLDDGMDQGWPDPDDGLDDADNLNTPHGTLNEPGGRRSRSNPQRSKGTERKGSAPKAVSDELGDASSPKFRQAARRHASEPHGLDSGDGRRVSQDSPRLLSESLGEIFEEPLESSEDTSDISHEQRVRKERNRLPAILIVIALLGVGLALAQHLLNQEAPEPTQQAATGKGRIVIDGQGTVTFDGRSCPLPCFRNVDANTNYRIVHGSDVSRFKEISVAPNETRHLTLDDL